MASRLVVRYIEQRWEANIAVFETHLTMRVVEVTTSTDVPCTIVTKRSERRNTHARTRTTHDRTRNCYDDIVAV